MTDYKEFGNLTDAEQAALLLAHHRGARIEFYSITGRNWYVVDYPKWLPEGVYRVKSKEPVITEHGSENYIYGCGKNCIINWKRIDGELDESSITIRISKSQGE